MNEKLFAYIAACPTAFHTCAHSADMLRAAGYTELCEAQRWEIVPGGKYFVTRNGSSLIAFRVPAGEIAGFMMTAAHGDSPAFKIKENAELPDGNYLRLSVEKYGGMLCAPWLDRPLSIAGRALVREGGALTTKLVDIGRDAALIPNMPIHFNREVNDGYKFNPQVDLLPLYGGAEAKGALLEEIARCCGTQSESIAAFDLFLYNRERGSVFGTQGEFFACPRIDDLECAFASLEAFLSSKPEGHVNVLAVFDNEEVGSGTKQGADSSLLSDALFRICNAMGLGDEAARAAIAASFMVSADNAHAVHPNHPEKYDTGDRAYLNGGVVIKHNANQKYTTDAVSGAIFAEICRRAGVPVQHFSNRSDILGGSTLGNIANTHVSMNTVDIGLAQLAMHSCYETAGTRDLAFMVRSLTAFYGTQIETRADGEYALR